ncbi:MAG: arsenate reductase ArsC, partial [Planctomycetota bacterium]|nr:arsenate reductase ArsC [Planctomycetota bacterium]
MKKVLFVCIHNRARSQMAEAFINTYHAQHLVAESAGLEARKLNPVVVEAMAELEIDISNNEAKTVDEILARGTEYDYVVTV